MANFIDKRKRELEMFQKRYRHKRSISAPTKNSKDLLRTCGFCGEMILLDIIKEHNHICPSCGGYFQIGARERIDMLTDRNSFVETHTQMISLNPLDFPHYQEKLASAQEAANEVEAFISGHATLSGMPLAIGALDSRFLMGSMGSVVGEKVARLIELSISEGIPLVIISASGGARMQEGIFSLMQMAKTAGLLQKHDEAGLLYISILTHPTTGGVSASFAMLGDVIIAEKGALIGFAGKRVIMQTIKEDVPDGFQTADFMAEHGMIDCVLNRTEIRPTLEKLLVFHQGRQAYEHA
jgi:acetyl-CoA carboxylase carboxyl transferase subunit beta